MPVEKIKLFRENLKNNKKERNRFLILLFSFIFLLDYFMFCYHTDKNIFDIFPSIPLLSEKKSINIYLPATDGKTLLNEKRLIPDFDSEKRLAAYLFKLVIKGSERENTRIAVPVDLFIRKIWVYKNDKSPSSSKSCIIDVEPTELTDNSKRIKGSEQNFKNAVRKTIMKNLSGISDVTILVRGIPGKILWEI